MSSRRTVCPIKRLHPRSGRQKVLAKASNKRPHFPQWPLLGLLCFFSCSSLVTWLANGTFTSSPAWISKGLQSSPTKVVFIHNLGCLNLDTSTKWIFCRNQLERLAWFRPTVQHFRSHLTWLRLLLTWLLDCIKSSCWSSLSVKAIWPSYPSPEPELDSMTGDCSGGGSSARRLPHPVKSNLQIENEK